MIFGIFDPQLPCLRLAQRVYSVAVDEFNGNILLDVSLRCITIALCVLSYLGSIPALMTIETSLSILMFLESKTNSLLNFFYEKNIVIFSLIFTPIVLIWVALSIIVTAICFGVLGIILSAPALLFENNLFFFLQLSSCISAPFFVESLIEEIYPESSKTKITASHPLLRRHQLEEPRLFSYLRQEPKDLIEDINYYACKILPGKQNGAVRASLGVKNQLVLRFSNRNYAERLTLALLSSGIDCSYFGDSVIKISKKHAIGAFLSRFTMLGENKIKETFPNAIFPKEIAKNEVEHTLTGRKVIGSTFLDTVAKSAETLFPLQENVEVEANWANSELTIDFKGANQSFSDLYPAVFLTNEFTEIKVEETKCTFYCPEQIARFLIDYLKLSINGIEKFIDNSTDPVITAIRKLYPLKKYYLSRDEFKFENTCLSPKINPLPKLPQNASHIRAHTLLEIFDGIIAYDPATGKGFDFQTRLHSKQQIRELISRFVNLDIKELRHIAYLMKDLTDQQKGAYLQLLADAAGSCATGNKMGASSVLSQIIQITNNPLYIAIDTPDHLSGIDILLLSQITSFLERERIEIFNRMIVSIDRGTQQVHTHAYYVNLCGEIIGHPEFDPNFRDPYPEISTKTKSRQDFIQEFFKQYTPEKMARAIKKELDAQGSKEAISKKERIKELEKNLKSCTDPLKKKNIENTIEGIRDSLKAVIKQETFKEFLINHKPEGMDQASFYQEAMGYDEMGEPTGSGYNINYIGQALKELGVIQETFGTGKIV